MIRATTSRRWLAGYFLVRAVAFTVIGLLMLIRPGDTVRTLARGLGLVLMTLAALDVVAAVVGGAAARVRRLVLLRGVVTAVLGGVLVGLTDATVTVVAIVAGMQLVVGGGVSVLLGLWSRAETPAWKGVVARGVVVALVGAGMIAWPGKSVVAVAMVFGAQWMFSGLVSTAIAVAVAAKRSAPA